MQKVLSLTAAALMVVATAEAQARDQIRIVGSSTVFPFSTAVAEHFGNKTDFRTPVVESTGSGGGLKLFCEGLGEGTPDITNASRRIKASEIELCAANDVKDVTEVMVGFDGIVLANSKDGDQVSLSRKQIFLALAKRVPIDGTFVNNPYTMWNEIDANLPSANIEVLGPPPTSGTRDAFVELVMEKACESFPEIEALEKADQKAVCQSMREDGHFIEAGENDNLIVNKLKENPNAFGIFGFSFLDQYLDVMQGSPIDGVEPTFDAIADGEYPVSRSLYFYVKNAHSGVVPGLVEFIDEFTSDAAAGEDGYLLDRGLIPLLEEDRKEVRDQAMKLVPLTL